MNKTNKNKFNIGILIGALGIVAGIYLIIQKDYLFGIFGTLASIGVIYNGYKTIRATDETE
jgi:tetrahydromethanopterin S-methyltransferase subunit C